MDSGDKIDTIFTLIKDQSSISTCKIKKRRSKKKDKDIKPNLVNDYRKNLETWVVWIKETAYIITQLLLSSIYTMKSLVFSDTTVNNQKQKNHTVPSHNANNKDSTSNLGEDQSESKWRKKVYNSKKR
ncbi:MAG: hypothetical protein AB8U25_07120 [Rickettsiales endosymbiont of Dermacentor nuttalli]